MFDSSPLSTQPGRILIVDDDAGLRHLAVSVLGAEGHSCWEARDGKTALELLHQIPCDLVLLDLVMPGMDGLAFLHAIHALPRKPLVLVLTGLADIAQILEVFKAGIYDILTKPILPARLCTVVKRGLEYQQLLAQNEYLLRQAQHPPTYADLVGRSPLMLGVFHSIAQAAPTHASILILGETGTGKEKVARAIHDRSLRAEKCFSVIDCTSIPSERMESTLFGYGQGVCSGGDAAPGGLIALSNGGTVFFDEVSHMPLSLQEKLVALLQTHVFQPVGEVQSMPVDVRVLAASSCNLEDEVAAGRFREDLYQQLNMVSIALPPLRERGEDTTLLAYYFLDEFAARNPIIKSFSTEALHALHAYPWPENIRELRNVVEYAVTHALHEAILLDDLTENVRRNLLGELHSDDSITGTFHRPFENRDRALARAEREYLTQLLIHYEGDLARVAETAGISLSSLQQTLDVLGMQSLNFR